MKRIHELIGFGFIGIMYLNIFNELVKSTMYVCYCRNELFQLNSFHSKYFYLYYIIALYAKHCVFAGRG
jgi:hypothetical protein